MLGSLNDMQIHNLLSSQVIGRIACVNGNHPYIVPVTYTYDGKYIYGQTNEGLKMDILRKNPNVCFEVDTMSDMRNWQSVIVYGKFEELNGKGSESARSILLERVFPLHTSSTVHYFEHEKAGDENIDDTTRLKPMMYRIKIDKMTGRFEKQ